MSKFKLCPFCNGNEIHFQKYSSDNIIFHYVECFDCECRTGNCSDEDAVLAYGYTGDTPGKDMALYSWNLRVKRKYNFKVLNMNSDEVMISMVKTLFRRNVEDRKITQLLDNPKAKVVRTDDLIEIKFSYYDESYTLKITNTEMTWIPYFRFAENKETVVLVNKVIDNS